MREFHEALLAILDGGRAAATATIVEATGSTPRSVGSRMIVPEDGEPLFTLGGGAFEAEVIREARDVVARGTPVLKTWSLADKGRDGAGQECGGTVRVYIEPVIPPERLWIFGAGHVGRAVAGASRGLGFDVMVIEDRPEFTDRARLPGVARVLATDAEFQQGLPRPDARTYCVVVTRSHRSDRAALRAALSGGAAWVGMVGSKRKRLAIFRELSEEDGIEPQRLERVETPAGLPIGAETPEEIAISILARIVQVRRQASTTRAS